MAGFEYDDKKKRSQNKLEMLHCFQVKLIALAIGYQAEDSTVFGSSGENKYKVECDSFQGATHMTMNRSNTGEPTYKRN